MVKRLSELNLNEKIKFGKHQVNMEDPEPIVWRVIAKNHESVPAYPENSVTLLTDGIIDVRAMDSFEPSNPDSMRQERGNNRYKASNLVQWLNSSDSSWYKAQHEYDSPPNTTESVSDRNTQYAHRKGFLYNFSAKEREKILLTNLRVTKNIALDGGDHEDISLKVFNPSNTEMGHPNQSGIAEGAMWAGFSDDDSRKATLTEQCFNNTLSTNRPLNMTDSTNYWMRSASTVNGISQISTNAIGSYVGSQAYTGAIGVRPALNLSGDTLVSDTVDADGCYTIIFNDPPTISNALESNLGFLSMPLKQFYTIYDPDGDNLAVTEKLNGEVIRTLSSQASGSEITFDLSEQWKTLSRNESHTASVELDDGLVTTTYSWSFAIIDPIEQRLTGNPTSLQPTNLVIPILPIQVLISNNVNDSDPVWEDASEEYFQRKSFYFQNKLKASDNWCVGIKYIAGVIKNPVNLTTIHEIDL